MKKNSITELLKTPALSFEIVLRDAILEHVKNILNRLLEHERTAFLGFDPYCGRKNGNSRNGYYLRKYKTRYGEVELKMPRDRAGVFQPQTIRSYKRSSDELEALVMQLYEAGMPERRITEIIEKIYGHHYSAATVSKITQCVTEDVEAFHSRTVNSEYAVIYCDATCINLRRDSVAKEAVHFLVGITPDGGKEILDYAIYPTESASNYATMLAGLKERGLKKVLLFVSDGLAGLADALLELFPHAQHQNCWVHLQRSVFKLVRVSDRKEVCDMLKEVYGQPTKELAEQSLDTFIEKYRRKYPRIVKIFERRNSLFSFLNFPKSIRASIYTSNLIEGCNKQLKRLIKPKEQFPNENSLDRFICSYCRIYKEKNSDRAHRGFREAQAFLNEMLDRIDAC